MFTTTMSLSGFEEAQRQLQELQERTLEALKVGMAEEGDLLARVAQELCPIESGALVDSALVYPVEQKGDVLTCGVQFGGPSAPYAVVVHEDLEAHHPDPNRRAKFLTRAEDELSPGRSERLVRVIDRERSKLP
jgi:hypothetical protein